MPIFLLKNYKLILIAVGVVAIFFSGYHLRTLRYEAAQARTQVNTIKKLGESQNDIVKFNSKLDKIARVSKDSCFDTVIPTDIRMLITNPKRLP